MDKEKYYFLLIIFGIILWVILIPIILLMTLEFLNIYDPTSTIKNFISYLIILIALIGLFLVHPLFFDQVEERLSKVTDFIISGIAFVIFGVICLLISIFTDSNIYLKFFGFPVLGILLIGYGITFFYRGYKK